MAALGLAIYYDIGVVIIMLGLHAPIADKCLAGMVFELAVQSGIGIAYDDVVVALCACHCPNFAVDVFVARIAFLGVAG